MKKYILLVVGLMLGFQSSTALAGCSYGETGYLYVWASCTQKLSSSPKNICQVSRDTKKKIKNIAFYSNVIVDEGGNGRYPGSQFFKKVQIQHNVSKNGSESHCYKTRAEAEDSLDEYLAHRKRSGYKLVKVHLRNN